MKYSQAELGRIFVLRLEAGETVHEVIEQFARDRDIKAATLVALGGADRDSRLVVGPEHQNAIPVNPMEHILENPHEITGTGTIFPDDEGQLVLHMHMACGRQNSTITGCVRRGVKVWLYMEVILIELVGSTGIRRLHPQTGFKLLQP
jgi:predicted DNA-binding protein with PD1-like motif